jgi:hypothetical protein
MPPKGPFSSPPAPASAAGDISLFSPTPLARAASSSSSLPVSSLSFSSSSSSSFSSSLAPRPPAAATATLFPLPPSSTSSLAAAVTMPSYEANDDEEEDEEDEEDEDESLIIDDDELTQAGGGEQRSHFSLSVGGGKGRKAGCKWTAKEDTRLRAGVAAVGECQWELISSQYLKGQRSAIQCSHRWQKVLRPGLVKGTWTAEEDRVIIR